MTQANVYTRESILSAKIAISNNLITGYKKDNVTQYHLSDGTEFQIKLENHFGIRVCARIYINGEYLGSDIVLNANSNMLLERFIETTNKFKFNVFEVDNNPAVKEIIKNNGDIKIEWFREKIYHNNYININKYYDNDTFRWDPQGSAIYGHTYYSSCRTVGNSNTMNVSSNLSNERCAKKADGESEYLSFAPPVNDTIKTGRIEQGAKSDQTFKTIHVEFEDEIYQTDNIKLVDVHQLADTIKQCEVSAKRKTVYYETKVYCGGCGRRMKDKNWKFCPGCGETF